MDNNPPAENPPEIDHPVPNLTLQTLPAEGLNAVLDFLGTGANQELQNTSTFFFDWVFYCEDWD